MPLNIYLNLGGQCEAAFQYYEQHLDAKITHMVRFRDAPPEVIQGLDMSLRDKIMHASLEIDGGILMATDGDCTDKDAAHGIRDAHVVLTTDTPDRAEHLYAMLADGGTVEMPMDTTFFARRFGMAVDRFGVPWMVICE